jgi:HEAT repeat protein
VRAIGLTGSQELQALLRRAMGDPDPAVRYSAALLLLQAGQDDAKAALVQAMTSEEPRLRRAAARELIAPATPEALRVEFMTLGLRSHDPEVVRRAIEAGVLPLVQRGSVDRALMAELVRLLGNSSPQVAALALKILQSRGRSDLVRATIEEARAGELAQRRHALRVLVELAEPSARSLFQELRAREAGSLGEDALLGLVALGEVSSLDPVRGLLTGADEDTSLRVLRALRRNPSPEVPRLLRSYREDSRVAVRAQVYRSLAVHPHASGDDFKRGLVDEDPGVGAVAMRGLIQADPQALTLVLGALFAHPDHAGPAARALVSSLAVLRRDGPPSALASLRGTLQKLEPLLRRHLTHEDPSVRSVAAEVLFAREEPMSLYKEIEPPTVELTYALLRQMAMEPGQSPLEHDDWLAQLLGDRGQLRSARVMAAAALWRAYLAEGS